MNQQEKSEIPTLKEGIKQLRKAWAPFWASKIVDRVLNKEPYYHEKHFNNKKNNNNNL